MKKNIALILATTGIVLATSANATPPATVTAADIQSYGVMITALESTYTGTQLKGMAQGIVDLFSTNTSITAAQRADANSSLSSLTSAQLNAVYTLTPAQKTQIDNAWAAATSPTNMTSVLSLVNSTLQSTSACSAMGTFPSTITTSSALNVSACGDAIEKALIANQLTSDAANTVAAFAFLKALGVPANILGSSSTSITVTEVVIPHVQRATSIQQSTIISNVLSNIFASRAAGSPGAQLRMSLGDQAGMAAGGTPSNLSIWLNVANTKIGNSSLLSTFDGNVDNTIGGIDYMFSPKFVAGVSLGYDQVSIDYNFSANSGLSSKGWMVAPYASYQLTNMVSIDGAYGYASGDTDHKSSGITTAQGYNRNFLALNLNGNYWRGDWQLTGKASYINAEEKNDHLSLPSTTNKMEQLRLGGQIGYWQNGVMPYASLTYVNDIKVSTPGSFQVINDKEAWVAGIGINLFSKGAIYGGAVYTHEFGRSDSKNNTFMANIGYRF